MENQVENGENISGASFVEKVDASLNTRNPDEEVIVDRVIMGLRGDQDEEAEEEYVNDEDFMKEMDIVDAWEGDEDRFKDDQIKKRNRPRDRDKRLSSRERRRLERRAESREKERIRREERKREPARRDPSKSNKDIERDKIRAKRDSESKLLAEKERAIKHILDSDEVVPPGTEEDAIESIVEKQTQQESTQRRKSLERYKISPSRRRRGSPYRNRRSPGRRSPFQMSPERRRSPQHRRSPIILSPDRRRSPERRRRTSWDRRSSTERRWSIERQKRRMEQRERELKLSSRRSRSRDRHRSPSAERRKRYSRSPRRRSHSRSRSPDRRRKRSPFINEIARQLRNEMEVASTLNRYSGPAPVNVSSFRTDPQPRQSQLPNSNFASQGPVMAGPPVMSGPVGPPSLNAPSGIPVPVGAPRMPGGPPFMNFDPRPSGPMMNFDQMPAHMRLSDFAPGPPSYGQPNPGLGSGPLPVPVPIHAPGPAPVPPILGPSGLPLPVPSPQPVPAPGPSEHLPSVYNSSRVPMPQISSSHKSLEVNRNMNRPPQQSNYHDRRPSSPYNIHETSIRDERLKTPEPPVISDSKRLEKTSLSSLLEASVSAKDSKNSPVLYPDESEESVSGNEGFMQNQTST